MQVILTKDVPHIGKKHSIITVKAGFGRNYLLPQGLAIVATPSETAQASQSAADREKRVTVMEEKAREIAQKLKKATIRISKKGMKTGKLYGSVSAEEIAKSILKDFSITIDSSRIALEKPIKSSGTQKVTIHLTADTEVTCTVQVSVDSSKTETAKK